MVKKSGRKAATRTRNQPTVVVGNPNISGEFNSEYAANRRDNEDPPLPRRSRSRSRSRTRITSPVERTGTPFVPRGSSGSQRASFLRGIPGSSSIANNASLRSPSTAAWVSGGSPNYVDIPPDRSRSVRSEPNSGRFSRPIDGRDVHSDNTLRSRTKPPSIPTTIPEQSDRSKRSSKRSGDPPSRTSSVEPMPSAEAGRRRAGKQRHHGVDELEGEDDFDIQQELYDLSRFQTEKLVSGKLSSEIKGESEELKQFFRVCGEYEKGTKKMPTEVVDYATLEASKLFESILNSASSEIVKSKDFTLAEDSATPSCKEKIESVSVDGHI